MEPAWELPARHRAVLPCRGDWVVQFCCVSGGKRKQMLTKAK